MATATESNLLEAQPRVAGTKNDARRVRREGKVPAVLYGAGKDSVPVSLDPRQVSRILHSQTGYNTIFDLALDGAERTKAMIVDWQYEPIKGHLLHIDLKRIAMDKALRVNVPIVLQGVPAEIVYSHHENYDGTGYPRGLKGNEIPLGARIVAVANTLDSITMNLPYRPARTRDDARAEIKLWSGRQFDPDVVNVFLSMPDAIWPQLVESLH